MTRSMLSGWQRRTRRARFLNILSAALLLIGASLDSAFAASNYSQDFNSGTAPSWSSRSYDGAQTYTATAGYYTNDNHNTLWSIATYDADTWTTDFTYSVDINSQFNGGTANALGLIYGYQDASNYYKIWFNTFGEAHLYRVSGGTATDIVQTMSSGVAGKTWYTIKLVRSGASTSVLVNGAPLFTNISQPEITAPGKIGLIAEWNYAQFDNVAVTLNNGYTQNFDSNTAPNWSSSSYDGVQTYTATGGLFTNDNHNTLWSIATYNGSTWLTDFTYSVDINSQFNGGPANALGPVYGFQDTSNYYKVWFNTFGEAHLYRVSGGTATDVAHTTTSGVAGKAWYTVTISRSGTNTSVSVNGVPLFTNISQPEITTPGKIGVISEWNYAEFDNVVVSGSGGGGSGADNPPFPRIGGINIGFPQSASDPHYGDPAYQAALARQHVTILGMYPGAPGGGVTMESVVQGIKSNNPNARVFLYTSENELPPASSSGDAWSTIRAKFDSMQWWLYDATTGNPVPSGFASGYIAMNNTHWTPKDSSQLDSVGWLTQYFVNTYFQPAPDIDGFFMDNFFEGPRIDGDWNRDGTNDPHQLSDPTADTPAAQWLRSGYVEYVNDVRGQMSGKLQIGNIGDWTLRNARATSPPGYPVPPEYQNLLNGGVLEAFIGETYSLEAWAGWDIMMQAYRSTMAAVLPPKLLIFNVHGSATDYKKMRYGLTSCLMDDGYFSYSDMSKGYLGVLWFDEFDANLGAPTSAPPTTPYAGGVYRRDFQNGIALVNPTTSTVTVNLQGTFRKINGTQDRTVNDGSSVTSVTLSSKDGIVLLR